MTGASHNVFETVAIWSQIAGAIAFLIVLVVMFRRFLLPAVHAAERSRNAELAATEKRRETVKSDVGRARAEVEAADRDAAAIRQRAAAEARREHDRIVAEAKGDGERAVRNAEAELGRARLAARDSLRAEFVDKALARARREADARIDPALNAQLVKRTVETLARDAAARPA
ncbi:MAG: hypothetical protein ABR591_00375 [Candidatus Velthaea sp.]